MFQNFRTLKVRQKSTILIAMLVILIPACIFASIGITTLYQNRIATVDKFDQKLIITDDELLGIVPFEDTLFVDVGIYMESIQNVDVKNNSWQSTFLLWFRWEGDTLVPDEYPGSRFIIGNGNLGSKILMEEIHENGSNYQLFRCTATVEKYYDTTRYPLESHQLKIFIEDERDMSIIRYVPDEENSTLSPYITVAGFNILNYDCGLYLNRYTSTLNHPDFLERGWDGKKTTEFVFVTRVARDGIGLFLKAFLSLFGILLWVGIGLFNAAYNKTDALGAINTGIFGVVSSMIVGMNLLSDARGAGLVEYINLFSLVIILAITVFVIHINRLRVKGEPEQFTTPYAKTVFWCMVVATVGTIAGCILAAYGG